MSFVRKTKIQFEIYSHLPISFFPTHYLARFKVHLHFHFKWALTTADEATTGRLLLDFQIMNRQISNAQTTLSNDANCWVTHSMFLFFSFFFNVSCFCDQRLHSLTRSEILCCNSGIKDTSRPENDGKDSSVFVKHYTTMSSRPHQA